MQPITIASAPFLGMRMQPQHPIAPSGSTNSAAIPATIRDPIVGGRTTAIVRYCRLPASPSACSNASSTGSRERRRCTMPSSHRLGIPRSVSSEPRTPERSDSSANSRCSAPIAQCPLCRNFDTAAASSDSKRACPPSSSPPGGLFSASNRTRTQSIPAARNMAAASAPLSRTPISRSTSLGSSRPWSFARRVARSKACLAASVQRSSMGGLDGGIIRCRDQCARRSGSGCDQSPPRTPSLA